MKMSPEQLPAFQQQQLAFTAHIRDPETCPRPDGIEPRRMAIYNELFFNNIESQLSSNFPVLRKITDDDAWHDLVRDFMIRHQCSTPLFTEVGQEFIDYLQNERETSGTDFPFMLELAHYEYAELAIAIAPDESLSDELDPNGDVLSAHPVIAPTAWNLSYNWPVHEIGPDHLPEEPPDEPTHLVVYRDRLDEVHFLTINLVTQRLITLLKENPHTSGLDVLKQIAQELQHPDPQQVLSFGEQLLQDLRERQVIAGTINP